MELAAQNLDLTGKKTEGKISTWLFNPFHYLAGGKSMLLGLGAILLAGVLASTGRVHLDGVLDFHVGSPRVLPLWFFLAEGLLDWAALALLLLAAGKLLSKSRTRPLDILGTQALARWPSLFMVAIGLIPAFQRYALSLRPGSVIGASPVDKLIGTVGLIASILLTIWMVALMYQAYAVSCNLKGRKAVLSFVLCLLAAEALAKFILARVLWPAA